MNDDSDAPLNQQTTSQQDVAAQKPSNQNQHDSQRKSVQQEDLNNSQVVGGSSNMESKKSGTMNRNSHHASSMDNISEWMAKKSLQESEKQIDLVLNRINLLKKEAERTTKKIEDTKKKTEKVIEQKKRNQEINSFKNNNKQNDGDYLKLLQRKSYEMRRQQEEEREAIRNALLEMKKEERNEIQRLRELNNKRIEAIKNQHLMANKQRHDKVRVSLQESKQNIHQYWQNHMDNIAKTQLERKNQHLKAKNERDLYLQRLEKQELSLINNLEQSQTVHEQVQRELEDVQGMPNQEVVDRYSDPKQQKQMNNSSYFKHENKNNDSTTHHHNNNNHNDLSESRNEEQNN